MPPKREHFLQSGNMNDGILTGMKIMGYVFRLTKKVATFLFSGEKKGFGFRNLQLKWVWII